MEYVSRGVSRILKSHKKNPGVQTPKQCKTDGVLTRWEQLVLTWVRRSKGFDIKFPADTFGFNTAIFDICHVLHINLVLGINFYVHFLKNSVVVFFPVKLFTIKVNIFLFWVVSLFVSFRSAIGIFLFMFSKAGVWIFWIHDDHNYAWLRLRACRITGWSGRPDSRIDSVLLRMDSFGWRYSDISGKDYVEGWADELKAS